MKRTGIIIALIAGAIASISWAAGLPPAIGLAARWTGLAGLGLWAAGRRSLTACILLSMLVGAEIGHDMPQIAVHARVLSKIFLKLIKTIIAPLLFSTLVVGIAGHADIRQVGRMGVKALVYFEVVTTLALFIGQIGRASCRERVYHPV